MNNLCEKLNQIKEVNLSFGKMNLDDDVLEFINYDNNDEGENNENNIDKKSKKEDQYFKRELSIEDSEKPFSNVKEEIGNATEQSKSKED